MPSSIDPYKVLGIPRDASPKEIQAAYHRAARKYHPDAGGDAWVFQQVQQAYADLRSENAATPPFRDRASASSPVYSAQRSAKQAHHANPNASPQSGQSDSQPNAWQAGAGNEVQTNGGEAWLGLNRPLPLRDETSYFILANVLDFVLTFMLLRFRAVETNPIANYFLHQWGYAGLLFYKLTSVAFVCLLAQVIAIKSIHKARFVLVVGTLIVAGVVVYSMFLFSRHAQ